MEGLEEKREVLLKRKRDISDEIKELDNEIKELKYQKELKEAIILNGVELRQRFFDEKVRFVGSNKKTTDKYGSLCDMEEYGDLCIGMEIRCDARDLDYVKFKTNGFYIRICTLCKEKYSGATIWRHAAFSHGMGPDYYISSDEAKVDKEQLSEGWELKQQQFFVHY